MTQQKKVFYAVLYILLGFVISLLVIPGFYEAWEWSWWTMTHHMPILALPYFFLHLFGLVYLMIPILFLMGDGTMSGY